MKLSDYVIDFVARAGVDRLFLLTGGGCMHLADSVGRNRSLSYVCCLHEQACAFAAEAYAQFRNGLGAALVTTGPGGTNAVTGVAAAWLESSSVLFLSGQAKRADLIGDRGVRSMGQQEVDIVSVIRPITKYARTILDPRSIRYELEKAVHLATHGRRGPVWLDIPLDVQAAVIDENTLDGFLPEPDPEPDLTAAARHAIDLLRRAERPVVLLGNGARAAWNVGVVGELLNHFRVPVLLTWKAADFLAESNELYAGRPGAIGQRGANFTQQNADALLVVGARLDLPSTAFNHPNFAPYADKVVVDLDPAELAKLQMPCARVCAGADPFLREMLRLASGQAVLERPEWVEQCKRWQSRYPVVTPEYRDPDAEYVNTYALVDAIAEQCAETDVLAPGSSGPCSDVFMQAFRVKTGQRIVNSPGLGAMGTGLPGSIGTCLASGRRRTICINGDGGFQLNIQELETVRRLKLPIKFFILCNGTYASITATQRNYFDGRLVGSDPSSELTLPDVRRVAEAYGIASVEISSQRNLARQVADVLARDGPVVCAVNTSPTQPTAPRVTSSVNADGQIVSRPMEDMWPFLSRDELAENMIGVQVEAGVP